MLPVKEMLLRRELALDLHARSTDVGVRGEGGADPLSPVEKASTPAGLGLATTLALLTAEGTAEGLSPATETSQLALARLTEAGVCGASGHPAQFLAAWEPL